MWPWWKIGFTSQNQTLEYLWSRKKGICVTNRLLKDLHAQKFGLKGVPSSLNTWAFNVAGGIRKDHFYVWISFPRFEECQPLYFNFRFWLNLLAYQLATLGEEAKNASRKNVPVQMLIFHRFSEPRKFNVSAAAIDYVDLCYRIKYGK